MRKNAIYYVDPLNRFGKHTASGSIYIYAFVCVNLAFLIIIIIHCIDEWKCSRWI